MVKFVERTIVGDIPINAYYNDRRLVGSGGYYLNNPNYQCVNYAIGRTSEISEEPVCFYNGTSIKEDINVPMFKRFGYGNAVEWWNDTLWEKTTFASEVRLGDIVIYGSDWGAGNGHVRIVERIEDNYLILSGGNEDGSGEVRFGIKQIKADGSGNALRGLVGYIHNPHLVPPEEEIDYKALYEEAMRKLNAIKEIVNG